MLVTADDAVYRVGCEDHAVLPFDRRADVLRLDAQDRLHELLLSALDVAPVGASMGDARDTGAGIVAVACPGCTAMLEGVVGDRPEVLDVAELVAAALEVNA